MASGRTRPPLEGLVVSEPMERCPYSKRGQHELMAIIPIPEDVEKGVPLTLACGHCGMVKQHPLTWSGSGSLDDMTGEQITEAVKKAGR